MANDLFKLPYRDWFLSYKKEKTNYRKIVDSFRKDFNAFAW